ncbi:MAG: hypothetical protein AAF193_05275 [Bacteroidota bacterium]
MTEFDLHKTINKQKALVFNGPDQYDIILGQDFLQQTGMTLNFELKEVCWLDLSLPVRSPKTLDSNTQLPAQ